MKLTFENIVAALDAGRLEMQTPWGSWVRVRRRYPFSRRARGRTNGNHANIRVFMEAEVEATISTNEAMFGFAGYRIAA